MSEWQPIETAPKDGRSVLLLMEGVAIEGRYDETATYNSPDDRWYPVQVSSHGCGCCGSSNEPPTHWMPLPEPPK